MLARSDLNYWYVNATFFGFSFIPLHRPTARSPSFLISPITFTFPLFSNLVIFFVLIFFLSSFSLLSYFLLLLNFVCVYSCTTELYEHFRGYPFPVSMFVVPQVYYHNTRTFYSNYWIDSVVECFSICFNRIMKLCFFHCVCGFKIVKKIGIYLC